MRVEKQVGAGVTRWKNYVFAVGGAVAVFYENSSGPSQTRYFHNDHLGSITAITNEAGAVVERLSYDAWGKRRYPNGSDDPAGAITSLADRGFTGHEHLEEVALVHMNGRVYDPEVGRFLSADPFVQDEFDSQAFNRYSYVGNNPLAYTDPSGFFLKGLFKGIGRFITKFWKPLVAIAVAIIMPQLLPGLAALGTMGSIISGALSGLVSSAITSGFDPRSMLIGTLAGALGGALGDGLGELGARAGGAFDEPVLNAAGEGLKEGAWASFGRGLGEGVGDGLGRRFTKLAANAALSGTHNGMSSGSFANGGATLGFNYAAGGNSGAVLVSSTIDDILSDFANTPGRIGRDLARVYNDFLDDPLKTFGAVLGSVPPVIPGAGAVRPVPGAYRPPGALPKNAHGVSIPDSILPHTQLGTQTGGRGSRTYTYTQALEWGYDSNGQLVPKRRIDFTDHGRPGNHTNPHQHTVTPSPSGGSPKYERAEPMVWP